MADGRVHAEQAHVIAVAVDALDGEHVGRRGEAESYLIGEAAHHDAKDLRTLGRRILEVVDPEKADEHESTLLEAEEARARRRTRFGMREDGEGLTHGSFSIPTAQAEILAKALAALAAPKAVRAARGADAYEYEKPTAEKLGQAFCEYIERYPTERLPQHAGMSATAVIVIPVETVMGAATSAHLDTGAPVSPGEARRIACDAGIIPVVLDTDSVVLDEGRTLRFHSGPQRLAIALEQKHCQHPSCRVPAAYCHFHHTHAWAAGGGTNTKDVALLCPFHHHRAHATGDTFPMRT